MIAKEQKRYIKNKQLGSRNQNAGAFFVMSPLQGMYVIVLGIRGPRPYPGTSPWAMLYPRLLRFINEAHRDGVMGDARYAVALSKARKLERFLFIIGLPRNLHGKRT